MSKSYKTIRDVNFGGTIIPANRVFQTPEGEESEAIVSRLLEKGSIAEYEGEATEGEVAPEVVEENHEDSNVPSFTPETTTTTPVEGQDAPVVPGTENGQPSPEQIDADLKAAGVS